MKQEVRLAGIFASLTFLVIATRAYVTTDNPLHAMIFGLGSSVVLGVIGYRIGAILAHPKGNRSGGGWFGNVSKSQKSPAGTLSAKEGLAPVTGEETFLEDIQP